MTGRLACACELVDATSTQVMAPAAQLNGDVATGAVVGAGAGAGAVVVSVVGAGAVVVVVSVVGVGAVAVSVVVVVVSVVVPVVVLSWPGGVIRRRWSSIADSDACADCVSSAALSPPPPQADKVTKKSRLVSPLRQSFLIVRS